MAVSQERCAVGVFVNVAALMKALKTLKANNFPIDRVWAIAKHATHQERLNRVLHRDVKGYPADSGLGKGAFAERTLEMLAGLLVSMGSLSIPTIGSGMLAGATVDTLLASVSSREFDSTTDNVVDQLINLGIPEAQAQVYHQRVERGEFLLLLEVSQPEIHRIETMLQFLPVQEWSIYKTPIDESARSIAGSITVLDY